MLFVISFIIIITAIVIMTCVKIFNNISRYKVAIDESKANVDIALAKRCDTITQMLNVAKNYARFERDTLMDATRMRAEHGSTLEKTNKTIQAQSDMLNHLFAVAESYPQLASNQQFLLLQKEITEENENFAASKRIVNSNISLYNQSLVQFPGSVIAHWKKFEQVPFLIEDNIQQKRDYANSLDYKI